GDVNGDGIQDIIAGRGPQAGVPSMVRVFDGRDGTALPGLFHGFNPYGSSSQGVFVASGDVNGDTFDDVIIGADAGVARAVKVYSGKTGGLLASISPADATAAGFHGGTRVAAGDVNGDGKADIVVVPGRNGTTGVKAFSGADHSLLFNIPIAGALFVAAGDVNGDGKADLIVGAALGTPTVSVFSGADQSSLGSFQAGNTNFSGGVRVAAGDVNGDGKAEIIVGFG